MKCCKNLVDGKLEELPFERVIATGYYDGPIEGFTECSQCGQTYFIRKLDWDDTQHVRIVGFAPIEMGLHVIAARLSIDMGKRAPISIVPPLAESEERFVKELFAHQLTRVVAVENWPGHSRLWRNVSDIDPENVRDWFSFLEIQRETPE